MSSETETECLCPFEKQLDEGVHKVNSAARITRGLRG